VSHDFEVVTVRPLRRVNHQSRMGVIYFLYVYFFWMKTFADKWHR